MNHLNKQLKIFGLMLSTTAILFLISACGEEQKPVAVAPPVQVTKAVNMDVPITNNWVGQTYGADDVEIRARVNGWLKQIHFREGSEVKAGQLLYTIDASELEQKVAEADANLAGMQTLLAQSEADVKRYAPLSEAGAVSKRTYEIALADYKTRQEQVIAAKASLNLTRINLGYAKVTSPFSGLIGISNVAVGDYVGASYNTIVLNTISRVDSIRVKFSITEQEYLEFIRKIKQNGKSKTKAPLQLTFADGTVYPFTGYLDFGQRQVDPASGTLQFQATFPNPERIVRPGQFARISAIVDERVSAVVIPIKSIIELQGQNFVYVVGEGNKVSFRPVKVGPKYQQYTIIEKGVNAGESVIVEGIQKVKPDIVVKPMEVPLDAGVNNNEKGK